MEEEDCTASRTSHLREALNQSLKRLEDLKNTVKHHQHKMRTDIEDEVREVETHVNHIEHHVAEILAPEASGRGRKNRRVSPPLEPIEFDGEEEGWASDSSTSSGRPNITEDQKQKSKASKVKSTSRLHSHPLGSIRRGRRTSLRRGQNQPLSQSDVAHFPVTPEVRGRTSVPPFPYSQHSPTPSLTRSHIPSLTKSDRRQSYHSRPGTSDSARNQRLEQIRAMHSSPPTREASPSRSVWFADQVPPSASMELARSMPPTPPDEATMGDVHNSAETTGIFEVSR